MPVVLGAGCIPASPAELDRCMVEGLTKYQPSTESPSGSMPFKGTRNTGRFTALTAQAVGAFGCSWPWFALEEEPQKSVEVAMFPALSRTV